MDSPTLPENPESTPESAIAEYRRILRNARNSTEPTVVANEKPFHCRVAFEELTSEATSRQEPRIGGGLPLREPVTIRIISHGVNNYFLKGTWKSVLNNFLRVGGKVKFLLLSPVTADGGVRINRNVRDFYVLLSQFPEQVEVKLAKDIKKDDVSKQLFLVENDCYRVEVEHEPNVNQTFSDTSPDVPASIYFNDRNYGELLSMGFEALFSRTSSNPRIQDLAK